MASPAAVPHAAPQSWSSNLPQVRKALKYIRRRKSITAEELVEWDAAHGRLLFSWNDESAAVAWRTHQARLFLNSFRATFEGMRVRAFIHVNEDEEQGIENAYYTIEAIAEHAGMREQVIGDVTKRMASLATELAMWNLTAVEQQALFDRLRSALSGEHELRKSA
jgi:hypothetical protein